MTGVKFSQKILIHHSRYTGNTKARSYGFTLVEMCVVLVIIGLLVGSILVGSDLMNAAATRAQITQINGFNASVGAFQAKYIHLPGDIPDPYATNFGFGPRLGIAGGGDGNGVIEGLVEGGACNAYDGQEGTKELNGETAMFWRDMAVAGLVSGFANTAPVGCPGSNVTATSNPNISSYFPSGKIGRNSYVYVWSGGWVENGSGATDNGNKVNYFGVSPVSQINEVTPTGRIITNPGMTVQQAYDIDNKMDDGLPQSGTVMALYLNGNFSPYAVWAAGSGQQGASSSNAPTTNATAYASTNCYDNSGTAGTQQYSLAKNASAVNCALSFEFQE